MATATTRGTATLDDLLRVEGKAELIGGRIIHYDMTGHRPNLVAGEIHYSLKTHVKTTRHGFAYTDNIGFVVPELRSGRQSFSPDAAYYDGPPPARAMRFVSGPPKLAIEVRSENDYGPAAERAMALKRADYFAAGTLVVWDVDPEADCIHAYAREAPDRPVTFLKGQVAEAEPAVPGWRVAVDDIFA